MYKILAIDDDKEILKLMKTALEIENYHVIT
ncbi:TPA: DNA-binding response regulator, partial [Streptococcus pyogenes]